MDFKKVALKIGRMRKAQEFVIYPTTENNNVVIQSEKCIGQLNLTTNKFVFTNKGCHFPHLTFAVKTELTSEQLELIKNEVYKDNPNYLENGIIKLT